MDPAQVSELFMDAVQIAPDDITFTLNPGEVDEPKEANQVLVGKILSRYKLGKAAIQGSLKLSWSAISGWKWKEIEGGLIQFTFAKREDAMNVLARRPCIPPFYWNRSNLKEMASRASPVHELPLGIEDAVGMSTLRFRATIDLNTPIFSGFFLRRQKLKDLWIQYKYERLPKLCFKCGLLTHDQSICFKTPTVVKDNSGNFYPMYEVWLKSDAPERSTFTTPLAEWFQDWVLQKQIFLDPALRNQLKVQKAIRHGESDELRECRRQLPGKKRIVTDEDNQEASQASLVITQLPLVSLPGIGEIAPFGNNTKAVSIQDLQELKKIAERKAEASSNDKPATAMVTEKYAESRNSPTPSWVTKKTSHASSLNLPHLGKQKEAVNHKELQTALSDQEDSGNSKLTTASLSIASEQSEAHMESPIRKPKEKDIPYYTSLLGSQAIPMDWPSIECWAQPKARELLMGGLTVDKFFREPTLLNPLMDINDFRVQEHLAGPRKRKALDGIIVKPSPEKHASVPEHNSCEEDQTQLHTPTKIPHQQSENQNQPDGVGAFKSGSVEASSSSKRRGRPRKLAIPPSTNSCQPRKRGRPPKAKDSLSATPKSFKWKKSTVKTAGGSTTVQLHKDGKLFDLKIDLDNRFVLVEKQQSLKGTCTITEIDVSSKYLISAVIDFEPKGLKWLLMGLYGPPHREDKENFWKSIGDMVNQSLHPVLLLGDMNGTLKESECFHYSQQGNSSRYSFDFRRMVNGVGLIDLGFQGPCYTWAKDRNNHDHGGPTKRARLDRGLA
ncbi:hypothetical protein G4B88_010315 [Cannabis sativa]|uniref:Zinc knuckle CX2CX4HX4C domain-containing protein n=1 Tax=Cannabis sativa TaxID=3483 RepID=A0A7J6I5R0_CANSA|nr:hypothetical protein G4B88_010315 [Cannabis sativa]